MSIQSVSFHSETLQFKQPAGTSRGIYRERRVWYIEIYGEYVLADLPRPLYGIGECAMICRAM